MFDTMAKKKPTSRHVEPRESFHLPEAMQEALEQYVKDSESSEAPTDKSKVCRVALSQFLQRKGYYRPKPEPDTD